MTDNTESIDELVEEMVDRGALPSEYVDLISDQVAKARTDEINWWIEQYPPLRNIEQDRLAELKLQEDK